MKTAHRSRSDTANIQPEIAPYSLREASRKLQDADGKIMQLIRSHDALKDFLKK